MDFIDTISLRYLILNFTEIRPLEAGLVLGRWLDRQTDRRTDGHDEDSRCLRAYGSIHQTSLLLDLYTSSVTYLILKIDIFVILVS
jgi:hypothetical protein